MQSEAVDAVKKDSIKKKKGFENLTEDGSLRLLAEIIANNIIQKLLNHEERQSADEQHAAAVGKEREAA